MGIFYDVLYAVDWLTLALPFIFSALIFYGIYSRAYKRFSTRVRTK